MQTRSKSGISKPKIFQATAWIDEELHSIKQALASPHWKVVVQEEYEALLKNKTWSLVSLPSDRRAVHCKWLFRIKRNADGSIAQYKARFVAKGFFQQPGIYFHEVFSPVVKPVIVRVILTLDLSKGWQLRQVDINNALQKKST
ncbi:uncharacterized mitochondrial protein AtMg00820-like [Hibiscus syriacus]|uniref:uncharacterized mitochondrial protein AtMg00820-like n=1 Tax=Hibiscus syriacus TaxID=106335 RepID=UPI001921FA22|nr:uncharacterized mitochondrial protein AtMg00820-like [Hibiscus syriacus]